ncbi:tRNA pseudouridine(38-40) synthase TruA [candidate division KSB1 bacterium]|nr:tRNA pseudouridine(38-40) synthase TruA [candidate division KSB1 bacterium]
MRKIKLILEYDGSDFCGWQYQPNTRTVQSEVESALSRLTQESIKTTASGRTDAGVHALGQVIHFFCANKLPVKVFQRGGNALLPPDVRIIAAEQVPPTFHARYSAVERQYRYCISLQQRAIARHYCWYVPYPLGLEAMQQAVAGLAGDWDFQSFCRGGASVSHYRCTIYYAGWQAQEGKIYFDISANRFLHNMVRILVGTCVEIGRGALSTTVIQEILNAKNRQKAGPTAPPHGLYLVRVGYEKDAGQNT